MFQRTVETLVAMSGDEQSEIARAVERRDRQLAKAGAAAAKAQASQSRSAAATS
jgi:hypothetical protein